MRLWQAAVVAGAAWVGLCSADALSPARAEEPAVEADTTDDTAPAAVEADATEPAPADVKAAAPATDPAVETLIAQLGADEFNDREAAVAKLKQLGQAALPALKRALESSDLEVASRADAILQDLQRPPQPARLPRGRSARGLRNGLGVRVNMAVQNEQKRVEVQEPGRTIRIEEGPAGIQMSVTGQVDGKEVTRDFQARTPEELRKQNPEAFELYDRFAGGGGGADPRVRMQAGARIVPPGMIVRPGMPGGGLGGMRRLGPAIGDDGDDPLGPLGEMLERQMNDPNLPEAHRRELGGLLERLRGARAGRAQAPAAAPDQQDQQGQADKPMDDAIERLDELREGLEALKLPDAGDVPAPPVGVRLGIEVLQDVDEGVTIVHVTPESRGAKLGLEPLDVITKLNGQAVADANALRRAVSDAKGPLVVEGTRDGEPLKLEEKPVAEEKAPQQ